MVRADSSDLYSVESRKLLEGIFSHLKPRNRLLITCQVERIVIPEDPAHVMNGRCVHYLFERNGLLKSLVAPVRRDLTGKIGVVVLEYDYDLVAIFHEEHLAG